MNRILQFLPITLSLLQPDLHSLEAENAPLLAKDEPILQKVAVIGASISSGLGLEMKSPGDPQITLATVVGLSIRGPHKAPEDLSSPLAFMDPSGIARSAVEKVAGNPPTLIVAVDFLFWFGYGARWKDERGRLEALEQGLKILEGFKCPILVGNFPDVRHVLKTANPVIPPQAIPSAVTLGKLNRRLEDWAKGRKSVILLPLGVFMRSILAGGEVRAGPNVWKEDPVSTLLQPDKLHATLEGTAGLWALAGERLLRAHPEIPAAALDLEVPSLIKKLDPSAKPRGSVEKPAAGEKDGGKASKLKKKPAPAPSSP